MNRTRALMGIALVAMVPMLNGCAESPSSSMSGAVYANAVPLYHGARFSESMGNESWGDDPRSYTRGTTWYFKTAASRDELLAFYEKKYPQARKTELDTGNIELRLIPDGAQPFEDVTIVIGDHELMIGENVRPETRERMRSQNARPAGGEARFHAPVVDPVETDDSGSDDSGDDES